MDTQQSRSLRRFRAILEEDYPEREWALAIAAAPTDPESSVLVCLRQEGRTQALANLPMRWLESARWGDLRARRGLADLLFGAGRRRGPFTEGGTSS
ncbi:MAG TPA: hypothetical protein VGC54_08705 [Planctomycetota bacterium]